MATPPPIGKTISVKVDPQTYDVLAAMTATGMTVSDAVRSALLVVGGVYRKVWDAGAVPSDVRPDIARFWITRCDPGQWPERGSAQTTVPSVYWLRDTPRHTITPDDPTRRTTGLPASHPLLPTGTTEATR